MNLGRFLLGVGFAIAAVGPLALAAISMRRVVWPGARGALARVIEAVAVIVSVSVISQLLGIVGLFERALIAIGCAAVGVIAYLALQGRRAGRGPSDPGAVPAVSHGAAIAALVGAGIVGAQWLARSVEALRHGMFQSVDTLWYHGPMAARWVQEGSITAVHYFDGEPLTAFFPGSGDLIHSVGIALVGDDILSPVINLGWLALVFVAAWCIGQPWGAGPACVMGSAVVLATPIMTVTQAGSMYTDVAGFAMVLSAVALLVHGGRAKKTLALAAAAAGFALGVKYTMIVPVGVLTLGVVGMARGSRWRTAGVWLAGLVAVGGLWYVRNLVVVGNPVPPLDVDLGPLSLPSPPLVTSSHRVIDYITDSNVVQDRFIPGLNESFGWAWWAIVLLALVGSGLALASSTANRAVRALGAMGLVSILAFIVTPQALGNAEDPFFFAECLRYVGAPLAIGLIALSIASAVIHPLRGSWVVASLSVVLFVTALDGTGWLNGQPVIFAALALTSALGVGAFVVWQRAPRASVVRVIMALLALVLVLGMGVIQNGYRQDRYEGYEWIGVVNWTRDVRDARIAMVGLLLQYPLYGPDLSNHVQWVSRGGENGSISPITSCRGWKHALNADNYDYAVITRPSYPLDSAIGTTPELAWMRNDPGVREIVSDGEKAGVFRIDERLDPSACSSRDDPE